MGNGSEVRAKYEAAMEEYLATVASATVEFDQVIKDSIKQIEQLAQQIEAVEEKGDEQPAEADHDRTEQSPAEHRHLRKRNRAGTGPMLFDEDQC